MDGRDLAYKISASPLLKIWHLFRACPGSPKLIRLQIGTLLAAANFLFRGTGFSQWSNIISTLVQSLVAIAINLFLIFWSRHRLLTALRETVSVGGQSKTCRWKPRGAPIPAIAAPGPMSP